MTMEADIPSDELNLWTCMSTVEDPGDKPGGWNEVHWKLFIAYIRKVTFPFHKGIPTDEMGNNSEADDLVGSTFIKVRPSWDQFENRGDPVKLKSWLASIATHGGIDERRQDNRHQNRTEPPYKCNEKTGEEESKDTKLEVARPNHLYGPGDLYPDQEQVSL